jgi:hypothetical protein
MTSSIEIIENYIHKKRIFLDTKKLKTSSERLYELIKRKFSRSNHSFTGQSTLSTKLYSSYNLLLYQYDEFHELFHEIKKFFFEIIKDDLICINRKYYIQCWLNYYNKDDFIDWHKHWIPEHNAWHGFYCLDTESSSTFYKLPNVENIINVINENNMIILSKSNDDEHKSSKWQYEDRPRITIAFDIVPRESLVDDNLINHWIPL